MGIRAAVRRLLNARASRPQGETAGPVVVVENDEAGFRGMLRRLDREHPEWSRWVGGRLDIEIPAILVSVGVHLTFLLVLATAGYAVHTEAKREIESRMVDTTVSDASLSRTEFQDLNMSDEKPNNKERIGSFSPDLAPKNMMAPSGATGVSAAPTQTSASSSLAMAKFDVRAATSNIVPTASMLGQSVSIKGDGAEHVGDVDGAVDRVANEILRRLESGRTLVIWAFDASGSLAAERERLSKHIETVYTHITQLDSKNLSDEGGLLTAVVGFGKERKALTPAPTADKNEIISAINSVTLDDSGYESTFQTVLDVVQKWGHFKDSKGNVYHPMIIVVTDEVGDDDKEYLEPAIDAAVKAKVPVYVLGSQAIFGRLEGYMDYTDPKTKKHYRNLPVRQGPESLMLEQIKLPYWFAGYQYDLIDSGFGPYALSRLAGSTGGIYFITRMSSNRMACDPVAMREYKPEWVNAKKYESAVMNSPVRKAVMEAALVTQQKLPGQPSLNFPAVESGFKDAMEEQQKIVARTTYTVDEALGIITPAAKFRDQETSRRWQAHFDLIKGRLLAMKIRCYEFNWACASMKKDAPKFKDAKSNAWKLVPDTEIHYSEQAAKAATVAQDLLKRVVTEHPGTPWALLAQRELKDPLGFKWVETYVKPIDKREGAEAKKKKEPPKPQMKPEPVPKL